MRVALERDHRAEARGLPAGELVVGVVGVAHVEHVGHVGVGLERLADAQGVALLLAQAHAQRLEAAQHEPGVEGVELVALAHRRVEEGLQQGAVAQHQKAAQHVVVAAQVLGAAVNHQVGAQLQGLLEVHGEEGVVHGQVGAAGVRRLGQRGDVGHLHGGVRGRLQEHEPGVGLEGGLHHGGVGEVHVVELDAVMRVDAAEQAVRAAVEVVAHEHVVAGAQHLEQRGDGRHAAGERHGLDAALEQGDRVLKLQAGGVAAARVTVAGGLAPGRVGEGGRLVERVADGAGALVDALVAAHGHRVGVPAGVRVLVDAEKSVNLAGHGLKARVVHSFWFLTFRVRGASCTFAAQSVRDNPVAQPVGRRPRLYEHANAGYRESCAASQAKAGHRHVGRAGGLHDGAA